MAPSDPQHQSCYSAKRMNSYYFMNCINKPIIFLGNRLSSNFSFRFLRSFLHSWVTFLPPTLQYETHSKATPTCIAFESRCNTCAVGTVSLGVFYMFTVFHLPRSSREEDQGRTCGPGQCHQRSACAWGMQAQEYSQTYNILGTLVPARSIWQPLFSLGMVQIAGRL